MRCSPHMKKRKDICAKTKVSQHSWDVNNGNALKMIYARTIC